MTRRLLAVAAGLALIALIQPLAASDADFVEGSLTHDGLKRWYRVLAPEGLERGAPVVLLLHGGTRSMREIFGRRGGGTRAWETIARREKLLLIAPNGVNPGTGDTAGDHQVWNDHRAPADMPHANADDVGFIARLLEVLAERHGYDRRRVYVTGASNGGMMTFRLLIEAPKLFAAGAAFIANLPRPALDEGLFPKRPTPLLLMTGTADPLVPYVGGQVARDRGAVISSPETTRWWIAANRAAPTAARQYDLPDRDSDDGCVISLSEHPAQDRHGAPLHAYVMKGGGHSMPTLEHGGRRGWLARRFLGPLCRDVEGAEVAWDFFRRHGGR